MMDVSGAWAGLIADWVAWQRAAGRPRTTLDMRRYQLGRFAADAPRGPLELDARDLARWLAAHTWAPNTARAYRAALRSFFSWLQALGLRPDSPAALLPPVRVPRGRPRPAPDDAWRWALIGADQRERRALRLAGQCGLRRGEVVRVHSRHVEGLPGRYQLRVVGKGGHVRMVPLVDDLADELRALEGFAFPSQRADHLTPAHLGRLISHALPAHWTMHTLRHRCATEAYRATGGDLRAVQELLGHSKPETTALYIGLDDDAVRRAMLGAAAASAA